MRYLTWWRQPSSSFHIEGERTRFPTSFRAVISFGEFLNVFRTRELSRLSQCNLRDEEVSIRVAGVGPTVVRALADRICNVVFLDDA